MKMASTLIMLCLSSFVGLCSFPGLFFAVSTVIGFALQCKEKVISSNIYGIFISSVCTPMSLVAGAKSGCHIYSEITCNFPYANGYLGDVMNFPLQSCKLILKLLITLQSFDRYILICKPHLKDGLTIIRAVGAISICFLVGVSNWLLDDQSRKAWMDNGVTENEWYTLASIQRKNENISMPAIEIAYSTYELLFTSIPCIFAIYSNFCIKVELEKACAFVSNERRSEKFARITRLSIYLTALLVSFFVVDLIAQGNVMYHKITYVVNVSTMTNSKAMKILYHPIKRLINHLTDSIYCIHSFLVAFVFFWFMKNISA